MAYAGRQPSYLARCFRCGSPVDARMGHCMNCGQPFRGHQMQTDPYMGMQQPVQPGMHPGMQPPLGQASPQQPLRHQIFLQQHPMHQQFQQQASYQQSGSQQSMSRQLQPQQPAGQISSSQMLAEHDSSPLQEVAYEPVEQNKKASILGIISAILAFAVVALALMPWVEMSDTLANLAAFSGMEIPPELELEEEYPIWGLLNLNGTLEAYSSIVGFYAGSNSTTDQLSTFKVMVFVDVVIWGICVLGVAIFAVLTLIRRGRRSGGLASACFALGVFSIACVILLPMMGDIVGATTISPLICFGLCIVDGILASIASRKSKS